MDKQSIQIIVEIIGSFFFISILFRILKEPNLNIVNSGLGISVGFLSIYYFGASISGAHFNPAISFAMFMKNKMELNLFIAYVLAQLIGTTLAIKFDNIILSQK